MNPQFELATSEGPSAGISNQGKVSAVGMIINVIFYLTVHGVAIFGIDVVQLW